MEKFLMSKMVNGSPLNVSFGKCIVFVFSMLLFFSCVEEVVEKPENLIAKDKMVDILYEFALMNSLRSTNPNILTENNIDALPYVYEKFDVDSTQLAQSDLYYASKPLEYQQIYEQLEERLQNEVDFYEEARKKRSDSIKNANQKRADSLRNLRDSIRTKNP